MQLYQLFYRLVGTSLRCVAVVAVAILLAGAAEPLWTCIRIHSYVRQYQLPDNYEDIKATRAIVDFNRYVDTSMTRQFHLHMPYYNQSHSWSYVSFDRPTSIQIYYPDDDQSLRSISRAVASFPSGSFHGNVRLFINKDCQFPLADVREILKWDVKYISLHLRDEMYQNTRVPPNYHYYHGIQVVPHSFHEGDGNTYLKSRLQEWCTAAENANGQLSPEQYLYYRNRVFNL